MILPETAQNNCFFFSSRNVLRNREAVGAKRSDFEHPRKEKRKNEEKRKSARYPKISQVFGFTRKILDDLKGLLLLLLL